MTGLGLSAGPVSLILAEDEALRQELARALASRRHQTHACKGVRKALQTLVRSGADLLVVQWPGSDGDARRFCQQAAQAGAGEPRVVLAVVYPPDPAAMRAALDSGASDVIAWPADAGSLDLRLRTMEARLAEARGAMRAAEALRASEERLDATAAGAAVGLWDWDLVAVSL